MLALVAPIAANHARAECPGPSPAVTAIDQPGGRQLAIVPDDSPLFVRALVRPDRIAVRPIDFEDLSAAAVGLSSGVLTCGATVTVDAAAIRSPVDGSSVLGAVSLPTLAPEPGFADPGPERAARLARSHDTITWKQPAYLPVRAEAPSVIAVDGGATLAIRLSSAAYGVVGFVYAPVVRLGAEGGVLPPVDNVHERELSFFVSRDAAAREALDDRDGTLAPGDVLALASQTYGAVQRRVELPDVTLHDPKSDFNRIAFAYGTAFLVPWVSSAFSLLTDPKCTAFCGRPTLPGDRAYLARFQRRSLESIDRSRTKLTVFELATVGTAMLTTLIPTNRRGVLSRVEILEDALIIGEAVSVSWTTPLFLQARIGRRRPVSYHAGFDVGEDGRDAIAPSLVALRSNRAAVMLGASMMLLIVEDAGWGWVVAATTVLAGLVASVAYYEVDSGLVFPWDIPVGIVDGIVNGMGVVAYHQIFWRGWPADDRVGLPLRLQGIHVNVLPGGGYVSTGLSF